MRNWRSLHGGAWRKPTPNLVLDARYEKIREEGVIWSRAVLVAIGIKLGRPALRAGSGSGQSGKPVQLEGVSAGPATAGFAIGGTGYQR
jgi:Transposase, Mutator family